MTNTIDASQPATGTALNSAPIRANFLAASNAVNDLQTQISALVSGSTSFANLTVAGTAAIGTALTVSGSTSLATLGTSGGATFGAGITAAGIIQSSTGGFKFPDNTVQTTGWTGTLISPAITGTISTTSPQNLFGTTAATGIGGLAQGSEQVGINGSSNAAYGRWSPDTSGNQLVYYKSRGTTVGSHAAVVPGDFMATISAVADDGINQTTKVARVSLLADPLGTISTGIIPGSITFSTANSSGALTNALTIDRNQSTTFVDGSSFGASGYNNISTYTFASGPQSVFGLNPIVNYTLSGSSNIATIAGTFNIPGGSTSSSLAALSSFLTLGTGSSTIFNLRVHSVTLNLGGSYTGTITEASAITINQPTTSGVVVPVYNSIDIRGVSSHGSGITSGTIVNQGITFGAPTASAAAGGTITNNAININLGNSSGAGTNTNVGLQILGNGGSGGAGTTTNRAILSSSTAASSLAGQLWLGYTSSNGAYPLQVNGQIFATSATIATSDVNFKTNIVPIASALSLIQALNPVEFEFIPNSVHNFPSGRQIGFVAQDVERVLAGSDYTNSLVFTNTREAVPAVEAQEAGVDEDGNVITPAVEARDAIPAESFLGLADAGFTPLVVKAIQELATRVAVLEAA